MKVRRYNEGEEEALWALLYDTVHKINSKDYTQAQIEAWAPGQRDLSQWKMRLKYTNPLVAVENDQIVGFAELELNGHIDCFYCAYDWQGKGVGSALLKAVEQEAAKQGITCLFAEVSITAKDFFEKKGFSVESAQTTSLRGEYFINYFVSKCMSG